MRTPFKPVLVYLEQSTTTAVPFTRGSSPVSTVVSAGPTTTGRNGTSADAAATARARARVEQRAQLRYEGAGNCVLAARDVDGRQRFELRKHILVATTDDAHKAAEAAVTQLHGEFAAEKVIRIVEGDELVDEHYIRLPC